MSYPNESLYGFQQQIPMPQYSLKVPLRPVFKPTKRTLMGLVSYPVKTTTHVTRKHMRKYYLADAEPDAQPVIKVDFDPLLPIYVGTGIFLFFFIIVPFVAARCAKPQHKGIARCSIMLTAVCMWSFWVTVYISQINPLVGPRVNNATLAWVALYWGNDILDE